MAIAPHGFGDLRAFIKQLRRDGDLAVIEAPVDPVLEAAEIHRRVIAAGGPALLFTNVTGAAFPLVTNLFGTARRAELAFGTRPLQFIRRLVELAETLMPPTPAKLWGARDVAGALLRIGTRPRQRAPVTEVVTGDVRLDRLPAITCWPEDGGPFITLPLVYTEHPERPGHNLGMYRLHVHDARSTGMHWQIGQGGRLPLRGGGSAGRGAARDRLPGRPACPDAGRDRAAAGKCAGADARLAAGRRAAAGRGRPRAAPADRQRRVRPDRIRRAARAAAGGAVRRSLRLLLARPRLPGPDGRAGRPPARCDLSGDRCRQATAGGRLHRGSPAGAAFSAVPAGDAGGGRPLVVWRNRLPLAGRGRGARALRPRGDGERVPESWERGSSRSPSSCW